MEPPTHQFRQVTPVVVAAAVAVALFCVLVFGGAGDRLVIASSNIGQGLAAVFAGVICLRVGRRSSGQVWDGGWRLVGYGMLAWAAGSVVWSYYEIALDQANPDVSLADLGFLGMVPLVLWGLAKLNGLYRASAIGLIEGLLIVCSMFYLSWATVLWSIHATLADADAAVAWAVNIAYPLGDVAVASVALILLASASRSGVRTPVALLAAGMLCIAVSDSAYIGMLESYQTGSLIDLGWFIGFLLIGVAGGFARLAPHIAPVRDRTRSWIALPYVPLAIVALASIVLAASPRSPSVVLAVLLIAMFGLVVARQVLAFNERDTLARDLASSLTKVRQQQEILNQMAFSDPLTGLANRALFEERMTAAVQMRPGETTAMFVDLDAFKAINDRHGHDVGDAVLVEAALRLRACCRAEDMVARVGGDEFVVIFQGLPAAAVDRVAHRFLTAMRQPISADGVEVSVSASIGTATGDTARTDVHELVRRADAAMYVAKTSGHGHYVADSAPAGVQDQPRHP